MAMRYPIILPKKAYHYRQYYLISTKAHMGGGRDQFNEQKHSNLTIKFQIVFDRFKDEVKLPRKVTRILGTCSSSLAYLYGYVRI